MMVCLDPPLYNSLSRSPVPLRQPSGAVSSLSSVSQSPLLTNHTLYLACNPYIKEHAVMCLKFLLEANPENQALVSSLEAREVVPADSASKDSLEKMGVDVALGEDGKVKVTRSQGHGQGPRKAEWLLKKERERDRAGGSARRMSQESMSARERFARLDLKERERGKVLGEALEGEENAERMIAETEDDDKLASKDQEEIEFM